MFHTVLENWVATQLAASEVGLFSKELVGTYKTHVPWAEWRFLFVNVAVTYIEFTFPVSKFEVSPCMTFNCSDPK
jgi:hypothetical protein